MYWVRGIMRMELDVKPRKLTEVQRHRRNLRALKLLRRGIVATEVARRIHVTDRQLRNIVARFREDYQVLLNRTSA